MPLVTPQSKESRADFVSRYLASQEGRELSPRQRSEKAHELFNKAKNRTPKEPEPEADADDHHDCHCGGKCAGCQKHDKPIVDTRKAPANPIPPPGVSNAFRAIMRQFEAGDLRRGNEAITSRQVALQMALAASREARKAHRTAYGDATHKSATPAPAAAAVPQSSVSQAYGGALRPFPKSEKTIVRLGRNKYRLLSKHKGKNGQRKNLGTFDSYTAALKHERAVEYFKHKGVSEGELTAKSESAATQRAARQHQKGSKFRKVLGEYAQGKLKTRGGHPVTSHRQAVAIAFAEQRGSERAHGRHVAAAKCGGGMTRKADDSFFRHCLRDEHGYCKPAGSGEAKPASTEDTPKKPSAETLAWLHDQGGIQNRPASGMTAGVRAVTEAKLEHEKEKASNPFEVGGTLRPKERLYRSAGVTRGGGNISEEFAKAGEPLKVTRVAANGAVEVQRPDGETAMFAPGLFREWQPKAKPTVKPGRGRRAVTRKSRTPCVDCSSGVCIVTYPTPALSLTVKDASVRLPRRSGLVHVNGKDDIETDDQRWSAKGILATSTRDRQGDIIECSGVLFDDHIPNPISLWDHGKWGTFPIGITESPEGQYTVRYLPDRDIIVQETFFDEEVPASRQVYVLVRKRWIRANSIAVKDLMVEKLAPDPEAGHFSRRDRDGRPIPFKHILKSMLAEVTWTSLPANPEAVMSMLARGKIETASFNDEPLDPLLYKSLIQHVPRPRVWASGMTFRSMTRRNGFTGEKKDKRGHRICFADGQHVPCKPNEQPGEGKQQAGAKGESETPHGTEAISAAKLPPRQEGESDKQYAKRVIDKMPAPKSLPEKHDLYFNTDKADKTVPIDALRSTKSEEENKQGGANAPARMAAAATGVLGKRDPITVRPNGDGTYSVVDGNGTFTAAKALGWKTLPVKIEKGGEKPGAEKGESKPLFTKDEMALPKSTKQPIAPDAGYEAVRQLGEPADKELQALLDMGKGIGHQLGYETLHPKSEEEIIERCKKPGGVVIIGPIKTEKSSARKVNAPEPDGYGGDWSKLLDIARATVAVDTPEEIQQVLDKLRASGATFARKPKDRMSEPTPEGYRDLLLNLRMKNGAVVELQVHLKTMTIAKAAGHKDYEITREVDAKLGNEKRRHLTPEEARQYMTAFTRQRKLYDEAWSRATGKQASA